MIKNTISNELLMEESDRCIKNANFKRLKRIADEIDEESREIINDKVKELCEKYYIKIKNFIEKNEILNNLDIEDEEVISSIYFYIKNYNFIQLMIFVEKMRILYREDTFRDMSYLSFECLGIHVQYTFVYYMIRCALYDHYGLDPPLKLVELCNNGISLFNGEIPRGINPDPLSKKKVTGGSLCVIKEV